MSKAAAGEVGFVVMCFCDPPGEEVRRARGGRLESGCNSVHVGQWLAALRWTEPQGWTREINKQKQCCGIKKQQKIYILGLQFCSIFIQQN